MVINIRRKQGNHATGEGLTPALRQCTLSGMLTLCDWLRRHLLHSKVASVGCDDLRNGYRWDKVDITLKDTFQY